MSKPPFKEALRENVRRKVHGTYLWAGEKEQQDSHSAGQLLLISGVTTTAFTLFYFTANVMNLQLLSNLLCMLSQA